MLRQIVLAVMLVATSLNLTGCFALVVGAAAGAGGVIWAKGKLSQDVNSTIDRAYSASIASLKRLELPIMVDKKDKSSGRIESEYADGKHVWIDLDYVTKTTTKIEVRVGTLGDQVRSQEIMDNILRHL